jgi:hypothetical protein
LPGARLGLRLPRSRSPPGELCRAGSRPRPRGGPPARGARRGRGQRARPRSAAGLRLGRAGAAIAFTAADPDAWIAEQNVERFQRTGKLDLAYNARLSADASPALSALPPDLARRVLASQTARLATGEGAFGLNLARERAREALP